MGRVCAVSYEKYLKEELKDPEFARLYAIERAKVAMAQKIAELRDERHLNQKQLAEKMGVSQQFISQIETGSAKNLSIDTLVRFASTLGRGVRISFPKISGDKPLLQVV